METYDPGCSHFVTPLLDPDMMNSDPFLSLLRTQYNVAFTESVCGLVMAHNSGHVPSSSDTKLQMQPHQIKSLKCTLLELPFGSLVSLTSHQEVIKAVELANVIALTSQLTEREHLMGDWKALVQRLV